MSVRSKEHGFPIVFEKRDQGVKITFRATAEVERFFQREAAMWQDLQRAVQNAPVAGISPYAIAGSQGVAEALASVSGRTDAQSCLRALEAFDAERPVLMQGTIGNTIRDREGETPAQTSGVIWAAASIVGSTRLQNATNQRLTSHDLTSITYGQAKIASSTHGLRSERLRTRQLIEALNDRLAEAEQHATAAARHLGNSEHELSAVLEKAQGEIEALINTTKTTVDNLIAMLKNEVSVHLSESKEQQAEWLKASIAEVEDFKRKVRIDVGLEEPTNFWTEKANGHRIVAGVFGVVFLLSVGGMVWWIESSAVDVVSSAVEQIVGERDSAALSLVPIAFITVPALAFAWVLRHLSRIIIQNLSLEADARLRGTITRTFKALAADRGMNEAELAIALQALFRPIDGKDHSEIAPPSLGDILKLGSEAKG